MSTARKTDKHRLRGLVLLLLLLLTAACRPEGFRTPEHTETRTIAVVLPMQNGLAAHWQRTAGLYRDELERAQAGYERKIAVRVEFYDEDTEDIPALLSALGKRDDIDAIIGGLRSRNAAQMASECQWSGKTLFTLATAEEVIRAHSQFGLLWAMTETDITQCEVLLSRALAYGAKSVALVCSGDDAYGKTFLDWFAFQAQEFRLKITGVFPYSDGNITETTREASRSGADVLLCVPTEIADIAPMQEGLENPMQIALFSDTAFGANVPEVLGSAAEGIEGIAYIANPETGFDVAYRTCFDAAPTLGEAQFYDALLLAGYGFYYRMLQPDLSLRQALRTVVDGRDPMTTGWTADGMDAVFSALRSGGAPDISGASGSLDFDADVYTGVLSTTYCHYKVYNGQYIILDYVRGDGSNRTGSSTAGWNWKADNMQHFDDRIEVLYPGLNERWALLVAGSDRWEDYRFQADVLAMYRLLKDAGYDDDHIVLIMEDNIAYHERNPEPGVVRVSPDGPNLYEDVQRDYRLSEISWRDIPDILCGRSSERLPSVIRARDTDNIFVFWSGHGLPDTLCWGYSPVGLGAQDVREMFAAATFRKAVCFFETCYSGSVAAPCTGIPGLLFFTATNEYEPSKADVFDPEMDLWLSNRFTRILRETLAGNPAVSLRELYYTLFKSTLGSHVMVYNNDLYGNMFTETMEEFAGPQTCASD